MGCGPGGIANLAVAAARFGLRTSLATVFGDDFYGAYCRGILARQEGVDLALSRTAAGWHTPVTVSLAQGRDRALITHGQEPPYPQDELMASAPRQRAAIVHLGHRAPRVDREGRRARHARSSRTSAGTPRGLVRRAARPALPLPRLPAQRGPRRWATHRTDSARAALGSSPNRAGRRRHTRPDGALAVDQTTGEAAEVAALDIDVVDATGAGDVFGASFTAATLGRLAARRPAALRRTGRGPVRHPARAVRSPHRAGTASTSWWRTTGSRDPRCGAYGFLADRIPEDPGPAPHTSTPSPAHAPVMRSRLTRKAVGACTSHEEACCTRASPPRRPRRSAALASGCSVPNGSTGRNMALWYWSGGLSDKVVADAKTRFDTDVSLQATQIGGYFKLQAA